MLDNKVRYQSSNLQLLLSILLVLEIISLITGILEYRTIQRIILYDFDYSGDRAFISIQKFILGLITALFQLMALVYFVRWIYFAYRNLEEKNLYFLNYNSRTAIWSWFVPVVNLILPFLIVRETLESYQSISGKKASSSVIVAWWWLTFVLALVSGFFEPGLAGGINARDMMEYYQKPLPFFLPALMDMISLILALVLVNRIKKLLKNS